MSAALTDALPQLHSCPHLHARILTRQCEVNKRRYRRAATGGQARQEESCVIEMALRVCKDCPGVEALERGVRYEPGYQIKEIADTEWITVARAARIVGCSTSTARQIASEHRVPLRKGPRGWYKVQLGAFRRAHAVPRKRRNLPEGRVSTDRLAELAEVSGSLVLTMAKEGYIPCEIQDRGRHYDPGACLPVLARLPRIAKGRISPHWRKDFQKEAPE